MAAPDLQLQLFRPGDDFTIQPFPRRSFDALSQMTPSDSSEQSPQYFQVAIPTPLRRLFDYLPPTSPDQDVMIGTRVLVPFGRRNVVGLVVSSSSSSSIAADRLKPISRILDGQAVFPETLMETLLWASNYYQHPCGEVIAAALPVKLRKGEPLSESRKHWRVIEPELAEENSNALGRAKRQRELLLNMAEFESVDQETLKAAGFDTSLIQKLAERGLIKQIIAEESSSGDFSMQVNADDDVIELNQAQLAAVNQIEQESGFNCFLVDGVTGSGKTEVYLRAMATQLQAGKQCLLLVPEIGLTPQTISRIEQRFHCPVVVLHSGLTDRERLQAWRAARNGEAGIIIGTRSAVFTPMLRPGLIIIDEEHDASFKQQDGFRYSARDVAIKRAHLDSITILLGSATPSLESLHNAQAGKFKRVVLEQRAGAAQPPSMSISDVGAVQLDHGFSEQLLLKIESHLTSGNQVLIFINRRGYAPVLQCQNCAWISECEQCVAQMTVHAKPPSLRCHHCGTITPLPKSCPACHSHALHTMGAGTQKLEQFLQQRFDTFPVLRIDRDSTRGKNNLAKILAQVHLEEPCVLLGTQMLAKGHHFPGVTLVAIVDADLGLFSADFRGQEQMAQTIIQVAGRAGRSDKAGEVVIQSRHGSHPTLARLSSLSYGEFADFLLQERSAAAMPPFAHLALLQFEGSDQATTYNAAEAVCTQAQSLDASRVELLGPMPAPMEKRAGRYRIHLLCKSQQRASLHRYLNRLCHLIEESRLPRQIRWSIDVDPIDLI